ncbi:hypothetical protein [Kitasatospora sp. HPMI-4]|uniref:hypothetical protein n=1 Tax=Kitasatospora sp. HPMI-4 TaxID=3448443 RepID=UPI003F1A88F0
MEPVPGPLAKDMDLAARLLGWLVPNGEPVASLTTADVERFCWYELPRKWDANPVEQRQAVTLLARLLADAGRMRPAAVCTSETTTQVLTAWQKSDRDGLAAYRKAVSDSSTTPPDTPELTWGAVMGVQEAVAHANASTHLEQALDAGVLDPAGSLRSARIRLVEQWLATPHPAHQDRAPLDAIQAERREAWRGAPPAERRALLAAVLRELDQPAPAPPDTAEPLHWLLSAIGDGVTLTQAGYLPRDLVAEAFARYPHWYPIGKGPRSEADLFQLADLHDLARTHKLLTKRHPLLKLNAAGRAHLADPELRQRTAALAWLGATPADRQTAEAATCALWHGPLPHEQLQHTVHLVLATAFCGRDGHPLDPEDTQRLLWRWLHTGRELGYLDRGARQSIALTATGRPAALKALNCLAEAPRSLP